MSASIQISLTRAYKEWRPTVMQFDADLKSSNCPLPVWTYCIQLVDNTGDNTMITAITKISFGLEMGDWLCLLSLMRSICRPSQKMPDRVSTFNPVFVMIFICINLSPLSPPPPRPAPHGIWNTDKMLRLVFSATEKQPPGLLRIFYHLTRVDCCLFCMQLGN